MELHRERPPSYQSHNPDDLVLPSVPRSDLSRATSASSDITLPDLRSVLGDLPAKTVHPNVLYSAAAAKKASGHYETSLNSTPRHSTHQDVSSPSGLARSSIDSLVSPSDTASIMSAEEHSQRSTSVSLEDPDVRLAAEALSGLGKSGYNRQSNPRSSTAASNGSPSSQDHARQQQQDREPLLCLLPGRHPWVGSTINGSMSAYNVTKNYSPSFVRYGADLIERNIGSPLASTVSVVAKRTGVENGLRRYLSHGRPEHADPSSSVAEDPLLNDGSSEASNKRRRIASDAMDVDSAVSENGTMVESMDDLPPYRLSKPPSYREEVSPHSMNRSADQSQPKRTHSPAMTVAGLYVAMSDASLRSLRYCVKLIVTATEHVETIMRALKLVLQNMDRQRDQRSQSSDQKISKQGEAGVSTYDGQGQTETADVLARRIQQYCDDIMNTLKTVVNTVSTYAGGALPENARDYIKQQLLSVPQRWRWATQSTATSADDGTKSDGGEAGEAEAEANGEARRSARRMIAFATEGIDMMQAVNTVIQNTCMEAERWMDTLPAFRRNKDSEMMDADEPKESSR
ncbi:hypothetical protein AAFC00_003231 [Neodothiora populina]|uniref:Uncharacterized protein n=1 Tax=Neodothiora populina TaxID=2781224 RepID=A0ABR3P9R9_9PEZI